MITPIGALLRADAMRGRGLIRWVLSAVLALASASTAYAQDFDVLRGPQTVGPATYTKWSGFYFGGHASYSSGNANFAGATQGPLSFALRNTQVEEEFSPSSWSVLGQATAAHATYGGYAGYNTQWENIVIGTELDYSTANLSFNAPSSPISRQVSTTDSNTTEVTVYNITADAAATLHLIDYGSVRARAGWIFENNFLPYAFGGFAIGRATYSNSSLLFWQQDSAIPPATPSLPCIPGVGTCEDFAFANASAGSTTLIYGYTVGAGIDIAMTSNIFLRGEFEYVHFFPLEGVVATVTSGRVGLGLKF